MTRFGLEWRPNGWYVAILFAVVPWAGCGDGNPPVDRGVVVKGKLLRDGQPLVVPNAGPGVNSVELQLIVPGSTGELESATAGPDGSFEFVGPGKGLKPGTYKLVVLPHDKGFGSDMLNGAFDAAQTPIQVTIPADKLGSTHDVGTIDLKDYPSQAAGS